MIFDNIDNLSTSVAAHRAAATILEKELANIRKVREVLGDSITDTQKASMIDALSVDDYDVTDIEARRIFAATEPEPEPEA